MESGPAGLTPESPWARLEPAVDEAILPPGIRLADESRPGRRCFLLLEGTATVEASGNPPRELAAGAFVGRLDPAGRPHPPTGITVRVASQARVLVIDPDRLAVLIRSDPSAAAAWRRVARHAGRPAHR
jgi:hypothetical protein